MILDPGMCWGYGANGVRTYLDEMPLPAWVKPPSPTAQAVPSRDSVWKTTAWLNLCQLSYQHLLVSGKFSGNITKWQQTGPGADTELVEQKEYDVSIHVDHAGSNWKLLHLFFWSSTSLSFCIWIIFKWYSIASRRATENAVLSSTRLMHWISSSAPARACSKRWTDLGRETWLSAVPSAYLPWGIHNSLLSCCLGLSLLHIPKCVNSRGRSW